MFDLDKIVSNISRFQKIEQKKRKKKKKGLDSFTKLQLDNIKLLPKRAKGGKSND